MSKACLEAAAKLFHPHAASRLLKDFNLDYDAEERLRFALTIADPTEAERHYPAEAKAAADEGDTKSRQIEFRNYEQPVSNPKNLRTLHAVPDELFERVNDISNAALSRVGGAQNIARRGRCYLPAEGHSAFGTANGKPVAAEQRGDDMRTKRLARFGNGAP